MNLTENNFLLYCAHYYDNALCEDEKEFFDDVKRLRYLKKMFNVYEKTGELNINLILNHIIILYNVFGTEAATKILLFKLPQYWSYIKSVIKPLGRMPDVVKFSDEYVLETIVIPYDKVIYDKIREILHAKTNH